MKYVIEIDMDNDIFMDEDGNPSLDSARHEMARILLDLATKIKCNGIQRETKFYSQDGNGVGTAKVVEEIGQELMTLTDLKFQTMPGVKLTRVYTRYGGHVSRHLVIVGQDRNHMFYSTADDPKTKYANSWPDPRDIRKTKDGFLFLDYDDQEISVIYKWGHV